MALASQTHVWVEGTATASWYGPTSVGIATTIGVYPWDTSPAVSTSTTDVTLSLVSQSSILLSESPTMRSAAASTSTAVPSISNQATSAFRWTNTSSATGSAATSTASACGNCCENTPVFTIDFDDLPHFSIGNDPAESDIVSFICAGTTTPLQFVSSSQDLLHEHRTLKTNLTGHSLF